MDDALGNAIESLALSLGALYGLPEFTPLILLSKSALAQVETVQGTAGTSAAAPGAIRGKDDVEARFKFPQESRAGPTTSPNVVVASMLYTGGAFVPRSDVDTERLKLRSAAVETTREKVIEAVLNDARLHSRLRDSWRLRPADAPSDESFFANRDADVVRILVCSCIVDRFKAAVAGDHLPESEVEWKTIAHRVAADFDRIRNRTQYQYRLIAFLNSPPLNTEQVSLGDHELHATVLSIALTKVPDSMIADVYKNQYQPPILPLGLARANTAVCVDFQISAESNSASANAIADLALEGARRVVDVLRVLREEDLGIGYAYITGLEGNTPALVGTSLWSFQDSGAAFTPRRGFFGTPSDQPLSDVDVQVVLQLVARHISGVNIRGFGVAIRRFRDAHERYWPGDPEALLDICIALEALFLGDQDMKELRHRLSLRVARSLSPERTMRQDLSKTIKYLYDLRSRIVHGDTAETMKRGDVQKLAKVMTGAPRILQMTLFAFLAGKGPEGITSNDKLAEWWSEIELG
jgi:hypothetical protein